MNSLEKQIEQVKRDLAAPAPDHNPERKSGTPKEEKRKVAKAKKVVAKKVPKKESKTSKNGADENQVTLADLASEAKITGAVARRRLRAAELSREGRWAWAEGSSGLKAARKALGLD